MSHEIVNMDGGIKKRVSVALRFMPLFAVVLALVFLFPHSAFAKYRDLYQHNTMVGSVRFVYFRGKVRSKLYNSNDSGFRQQYALAVRGKLISRNLIIYDAGVVHSRDSNKSTTGSGAASTSKYRSTTYRLTTTLIPRSAIPLTLRTSRSSEDYVYADSSTRTVRNVYGFDWSLKMRGLPEVLTTYDRTVTDSANSQSTTQIYRLSVKKELGITDNKFDFYKRDRNSSKEKSNRTNIAYANKTYLSSTTVFRANATRNASAVNSSKNTTTAANLSLNSAPGPDFNQSHNYSFMSSKTSTTNEGTHYSGSLRFNVTERLATALSLSTYEQLSQNAAQKHKQSGTESANSIHYRLTRRLTWVNTASYFAEKNNAQNANLTGANRTRYQFLTGVNYRRVFRSLISTASYRAGYIEEKNDAVGNAALKKKRGMTQGAALGLSKVRLWNYALMNTRFQYSEAKNMINDSFTNTTFYAADVVNTAGLKYLLAKANYTRKHDDSWVRGLNKKSEAYGIDLSTGYFKRSNGSVGYSRINTSTYAVKTSTTEMRANGRTQRASFAGDTALELEGRRSTTSQSLASENSSTALDRFNVRHVFSILRTTVLGFSMKRFSNSRNKQVMVRNNMTTLKLNHKRTLLGGAFMADYAFSKVKRSHYNDSENYKTHKVEMTYSRRLGAKISGLFGIMKSKSTGTFLYTQLPDETVINATMLYLLRDWTLSMEYVNKTSKYTYDTVKSNRIMFSVSRQFIREW